MLQIILLYYNTTYLIILLEQQELQLISILYISSTIENIVTEDEFLFDCLFVSFSGHYVGNNWCFQMQYHSVTA
jgi:hypothetical protein